MADGAPQPRKGAAGAHPEATAPTSAPANGPDRGRILGVLVTVALTVGALTLSGVAIAVLWPEPTLHGTVYDASDGALMPGATVQLACTQPRFTLEATTGPDGRYELSLPARNPGASACANGTLTAIMPSQGTGAEADAYMATVLPLAAQPLVGAVQQDLGLSQARPIELRGRVFDAATGELVSGARMAAPFQDLAGSDRTARNQTHDEALDGRGDNYVLRLRQDMPEYVIVTVDARPGYPMQAKQVRLTPEARAGTQTIHLDFALSNASSPIVLLEPGLVHLGNNVYTGSANSQFQLRANGTQRTWTFDIDAKQAERGGALKFLAKGVQMPMNVTFGNQSLGTMCCSPGDGSFGWLRIDVPPTVLRAGLNRLTLTTGYTFEEHDDVELTQVLLEFP